MIEYKRGYFKALLDVCNYFDEHSDTLKYHKMYSEKNITKLLRALLENRDELMRTGSVRLIYNTYTKEFLNPKRE